jgi:hypothetical protein
VRVATETSKGHGRLERRTITTTTWLNEYLSGWPGVAQVFRLERRRKLKGREDVEVVYGITSLGELAADAAMLLGYPSVMRRGCCVELRAGHSPSQSAAHVRHPGAWWNLLENWIRRWRTCSLASVQAAWARSIP